MFSQKKGASGVYREQQRQRVKESASLADKFPQLKSLTVVLVYSFPDDGIERRQLNYVVNVDNAKSVFCLTCPNDQCVRGGFDLTKELANAVTKRRNKTAGEISCEGWRSKAAVGRVHCPNMLRYKFRLAYSVGKARRHAAD